jgi:hypothetical protein
MSNPNHDSRGRFASGETGASIDRYPVAPHVGAQSVGTHNAGKRAIGTYSTGPGFTIDARTGKPINKGVAVAGGDGRAKAIGGGAGWPTERVTIAREPVLGKSLGRKRDQIAVYDLAKQREIATGGRDKGRARRAA